jgi:osmotically inducible protein OsmC
MALANSLATAGFPATSVHSKADVTLGKDNIGFLITDITLTVTAAVPKIDNATFDQHVQKINKSCIIQRALGAVPKIAVNATLKN